MNEFNKINVYFIDTIENKIELIDSVNVGKTKIIKGELINKKKNSNKIIEYLNKKFKTNEQR